MGPAGHPPPLNCSLQGLYETAFHQKNRLLDPSKILPEIAPGREAEADQGFEEIKSLSPKV